MKAFAIILALLLPSAVVGRIGTYPTDTSGYPGDNSGDNSNDSGNDLVVGEVPLQINGTSRTWYLACQSQGEHCDVDYNGGISLGVGAEAYLVPRNSSLSSPYTFYPKWYLLGKQISFKIDASKLDCGCVGSILGVSMPAYYYSQSGNNNDNSGDNNNPSRGSSGNAIRGNSYYFCDSSNGLSDCSVMDFLRLNSLAIEQSPHSCSSNENNDYSYYSFCDTRDTCVLNTVRNFTSTLFGPTSDSTIDSSKSFNVTIRFAELNDKLSYIHTTLYQGKNNEFNFFLSEDICHGAVDFSWLTDQLRRGIVLVLNMDHSDGSIVEKSDIGADAWQSQSCPSRDSSYSSSSSSNSDNWNACSQGGRFKVSNIDIEDIQY